ncbi:MAG: hypothetical protein JO250_08975 [Armatimonadetes bacterium]|nr:hypothetical protein [Armatimonadota bacterium]
MEPVARFQSVWPIGDTDPRDLPVADVHRAIAYYQDKIGFRVAALEGGAATLTRDKVTLRLAQNGGDPEQASCYIGVSAVDALHRELRDRGAGVAETVSDMTHDGTTYRVIWLRDPDGLCYCLGQPKATPRVRHASARWRSACSGTGGASWSARGTTASSGTGSAGPWAAASSSGSGAAGPSCARSGTNCMASARTSPPSGGRRTNWRRAGRGWCRKDYWSF